MSLKKSWGTLKGIKVHLNVKLDCTPKFMKARPVSFAVKSKVEAELERLQKEGIITKTDYMYSDFATPIVAVPSPKLHLYTLRNGLVNQWKEFMWILQDHSWVECT